MSILNGYTNLEEFKAYLTAPGQSLNTDIADDSVIEGLIEIASRRVEDLVGMGRVFYPYVQSLNYDLPDDGVLWLGADLLEVISLTNGDGTAITSTNYILLPANYYPKYALKLRDVSGEIWEASSTGSGEQVIALNGIWGYRELYNLRGWKTASTINEAGTLNASDTTFTVANGDLYNPGDIIKIENEIMNISGISKHDLTVIQRGDNGSTAATHADLTAVKVWEVHKEISQLALEIARMMYRSRYGEAAEETVVTPAGMVINPRSLPSWAQEVINKYRRRV